MELRYGRVESRDRSVKKTNRNKIAGCRTVNLIDTGRDRRYRGR